jgi:hypothetical protein
LVAVVEAPAASSLCGMDDALLCASFPLALASDLLDFFDDFLWCFFAVVALLEA